MGSVTLPTGHQIMMSECDSGALHLRISLRVFGVKNESTLIGRGYARFPASKPVSPTSPRMHAEGAEYFHEQTRIYDA